MTPAERRRQLLQPYRASRETMAAIRIILAVLTVAMRKSIHGLWAAVHEHLSQTPRAQFRAPLASLPALTYRDNRTPLAPAA